MSNARLNSDNGVLPSERALREEILPGAKLTQGALAKTNGRIATHCE